MASSSFACASGEASLGVQFSQSSRRSLHQSVEGLESCSLVCKVLGSTFSGRMLQDFFQAELLRRFHFRMMKVSPLGFGSFRIQFETAAQAEQVLAQNPVDFGRALGFLARWTQDLDLSSLGEGLAVTVRFPRLLPEFLPFIHEISGSLGHVLSSGSSGGADRTVTSRVILHPSLVKNPPRFLSLPGIRGGEVLLRVFFIGLPDHCFICGTKGHLAAQCSRRRVSQEQRQKAVVEEQVQPAPAPQGRQDSTSRVGSQGAQGQDQGVPIGSSSQTRSRQRSDSDRARRREAKKRRRQRARQSEVPGCSVAPIPPRVTSVYRRRVPLKDVPSSSAAPFFPTGPFFDSEVPIPILLDPPEDPPVCVSSSYIPSPQAQFPASGESLYDEQFPKLVVPRKSARLLSKK